MAETSKTLTNSQAMSLFLLLLIIVPLSARRINSLQSTTKFHGGATTSHAAPAGGRTTVANKNREFLGAAHGVPSGPNPIGNRHNPSPNGN